MLKKKLTISLCFSLFLLSSAFAPCTFAASVETVGDLDVNGWIWSKSGGFKFPDGSTLATAGLNGLLFNVGFVVDNSGSNAGNLTSGAIKFGAGNGATGEGIASQRIGSGNVNGLDFYTNSTARISIANGTGYVGIGTRTPTFPLDVRLVRSFTHARFGVTSYPLFLMANMPQIGFNAYYDAGFKYGSSGYAGYLGFGQDITGGFTFATAPSGAADAAITRTVRMAITNEGRVGIGTISPSQSLDVAGNINASGALTGHDGYFTSSLNLDQGDTNNGVLNGAVLTFGNGSGEGIASKRTATGNQYGLDFYTNFGKRMSISQAGRVGIGSDPAAITGLLVAGDTGSYNGISVTNPYEDGNGIRAQADNGSTAWAVAGISSEGYGIYGSTTSGYAGYFSGRVNVSGTLTKSGGSFRIDHPLDPANKYLSHSFVESPDMKNIYDGIAVLDANGEAVVDLPDWFQALNRDFRYQLTAVGAPGPDLHIAKEVTNNSFRIAGGKANGKVSWQVTGIRQDAWANAHRIPVEEAKPAAEAGSYLHPGLFGQPETKGVHQLLKK
jgi:hypothetical protein